MAFKPGPAFNAAETKVCTALTGNVAPKAVKPNLLGPAFKGLADNEAVTAVKGGLPRLERDVVEFTGSGTGNKVGNALPVTDERLKARIADATTRGDTASIERLTAYRDSPNRISVL